MHKLPKANIFGKVGSTGDSTKGSSIAGYFDASGQLQIIEIIVYGETGRWIDRFYPMQDAVAILCESIWYIVPMRASQ